MSGLSLDWCVCVCVFVCVLIWFLGLIHCGERRRDDDLDLVGNLVILLLILYIQY